MIISLSRFKWSNLTGVACPLCESSDTRIIGGDFRNAFYKCHFCGDNFVRILR